MKAVRFMEFGGPEVLEYTDVKRPEPGPGQVLIKVNAIGANYADTMRRQGTYVVPTPLPFIPGSEVAGEVAAVGPGVENVKTGSRAVALTGKGAYAEYVVADVNTLIPVPDQLDDAHAAALPLQGLTAYHIISTMGKLEKGESIVVHAAAGGAGSLSVQLARYFGAGKIIATASTETKRDFALEMGADHAVDYTKERWEEEVMNLTDGKGADVILEMAGGDIFHKSLACLAPFGRLVIFGAASGEQPVFNPVELLEKNKTVTGFFLPQMLSRPELFSKSLEDLITLTAKGDLKLTVGRKYSLSEAALLHSDIENRKTHGKLILVP